MLTCLMMGLNTAINIHVVLLSMMSVETLCKIHVLILNTLYNKTLNKMACQKFEEDACRERDCLNLEKN